MSDPIPEEDRYMRSLAETDQAWINYTKHPTDDTWLFYTQALDEELAAAVAPRRSQPRINRSCEGVEYPSLLRRLPVQFAC